MKKHFLIIALFLGFLSIEVHAQSGGGKSIAVELSLSPFENSEALLTPYYIKGRYFIAGFGARLSLGTNMIFQGNQEDNPESVKKFTFFDIRPGIEYHIGATNEAIPFVGIDFIYSRRGTKFVDNVGESIYGAWDELQQNRGFTNIGFNLVAGGDYYIKGGNLFVGTEIGLEFLRQINHEVIIEHPYGKEVLLEKTRAYQFRPTLNSTIRIGIAF